MKTGGAQIISVAELQDKLQELQKRFVALQAMFALSALIVTVMILAAWQKPAGVQGALKVRELQVIGVNNEVEIKLGHGNRGGRIAVSDSFGGEKFEVEAIPRGASLTIGEGVSGSYGNCILLTSSSFGSYVRAIDSSRVESSIAVQYGKGSFEIQDPEGKSLYKVERRTARPRR